ncbi:MAG: UDP-glucose 4-epimerase GalE [Pseudanabaenaceae cyanobacterium bins.68]|nr:UDP-glucose 4-epimerase GalE [Pseudanabaenaceae cyanobacterium bins.68]
MTEILVTGGAGYIGSHGVLALLESGYRVVVLDNLVYGHLDLVDKLAQLPGYQGRLQFIQGDVSDRALLDQIFTRHQIRAVLHFAAYAYVGESVQNPAKYYRNNVFGTLTLLEAMVVAQVKALVFSSTCATYGLPQHLPITESHPQHPINPYGRSKLMVEQILEDFDQAYGLRSVRFRYFNAAGADPLARLGEDHSPETHLLPLILFTALGKRPAVAIFGSDYPTPDRTCVRDYIHVTDLAAAHVLGLEYLLTKGESDVFNLGNGQGFSVRQVIERAIAITGRPIPVIESPRRPGDPDTLVGSSAKARNILGWQPRYEDLDLILHHAWQWHQLRHGS